MKIYVLDNAGKIQPSLLTTEDDVTFYSDEIEALNAVEVLPPDLVILDFGVRGADTTNYIDLVLARSPAASVVVTGDDLQEDEVLGCLLVGAKGYQNNRQLPIYIGKIIRVIAAGEAWISRRMTARLLDVIRREKLFVFDNLAVSGLPVEPSIIDAH